MGGLFCSVDRKHVAGPVASADEGVVSAARHVADLVPVLVELLVGFSAVAPAVRTPEQREVCSPSIRFTVTEEGRTHPKVPISKNPAGPRVRQMSAPLHRSVDIWERR